MRVRSDGPQLISQLITKYLAIDCSVLMGANIAGDIGREQLSEAVIGYSNPEHAKVCDVGVQRCDISMQRCDFSMQRCDVSEQLSEAFIGYSNPEHAKV
jgi:glycerol-3-phosphate dehydrogenase